MNINKVKKNFSNIDFIIPYQHGNNFDRVKNLSIVLYYILDNFDTNIYLKETGSNSYETHIIPYLNYHNIDISKIKYFNEKTYYENFPKTKILNDLIMETKNDFIIMHDADILLPIFSYSAISKITEEDCDFLLPIGDHGSFLIKKENDFIYLNPHTIYNMINVDPFLNNVNPYLPGPPGGVHFMRKKAYFEGYLENENFSGYGPEDSEKILRFKKLGFKVERFNGAAFDLLHEKNDEKNIYGHPLYRTKNIENNLKLYEYLISLNREELIEYYKNQKYFKKRMKGKK